MSDRETQDRVMKSAKYVRHVSLLGGLQCPRWGYRRSLHRSMQCSRMRLALSQCPDARAFRISMNFVEMAYLTRC
jgi:hypothetical protein